jgi:hypothetical protein
MEAHFVIVAVGLLVGLLQGVIILMLKQNSKKIDTICGNITVLQKQMGDKAEESDHQRVEVKLGQFGDRILTLELAVKVIEKAAV